MPNVVSANTKLKLIARCFHIGEFPIKQKKCKLLIVKYLEIE
jgi:hypothetical protein